MVYILLQISVPILKYEIISCTQSTIKVEYFVRLNRTSSATNLVPVVPYKFVKYALMLVPVILFSYQLLCPKLFRNNPPGYGSIPVHLLQVLIRLSLAPSPGHSICWQSVWARQIKTVKVAFTNYCPACTGESVTQFCFRQVQENANLYVLLNDKIYSLHESLIYVLKLASSSGASHICCERVRRPSDWWRARSVRDHGTKHLLVQASNPKVSLRAGYKRAWMDKRSISATAVIHWRETSGKNDQKTSILNCEC